MGSKPIKVTSTCTSLLIQGLIYYHPTKTIGLESPNGGTFSNKYAHGAYVNVANVAQYKSIPKINLT
jgi:hypothetical protein